MRFQGPMAAALLLLAAVLAPRTAEAGGAAKVDKPSRAELKASYAPHVIAGVPWYEGVGAARAFELRQFRKADEARLILHVRMLGRLDGPT